MTGSTPSSLACSAGCRYTTNRLGASVEYFSSSRFSTMLATTASIRSRAARRGEPAEDISLLYRAERPDLLLNHLAIAHEDDDGSVVGDVLPRHLLHFRGRDGVHLLDEFR